jgi:hypothetical protein
MSVNLDFINAFQVGVSAAQKAEIDQRIINSVFVDLNSSILEVTKGKVEIEIKPYKSYANSLGSLISASTFKMLRDSTDVDSKISPEMALYAKKVNTNEDEYLAEWYQDKTGFPCSIKIGSVKESARDKESLIQMLLDLLKHPTVGAKFQKLMKDD